MSHDKPGPNELRLRELREQRERAAKAKAPRTLIPFAGKEKLVRGGRYSPNTKRTTKGETK